MCNPAVGQTLAKSYGPEVQCFHLIVDNDGINSVRATRRVLEALAGRIVLHFLPPYSPDVNRIKRVWQDLHANVPRNYRCKTMRHLLANARDHLDGYVWRRCTGSRPVIAPPGSRAGRPDGVATA